MGKNKKEAKTPKQDHENINKSEQNAANGTAQHAVGYKNPPRHTRFKPGQSGNAKGRPKKSASVEDVIRKRLGKIVPITVAGKVERVSTLEVIALQQVNQAIKGNHKSAVLLLGLYNQDGKDGNNNISNLLDEFRSMNAAHEAAEIRKSDSDEPANETKLLPSPKKKGEQS
jgi:hypothetical protein